MTNLTESTTETLSVIEHDLYDEAAYNETLAMFPRLNQTIAETSGRLPTARAFIADMFYSLFKPSPALRSVEELCLSATINRTIIEQMMSTTEWESIRQEGTIGDQLYSAIATATVAKSVLSALDRKILQRMKELHEAEEEASRLFDQAETLEDLAKEREGDQARTLYDQAKSARDQAEKQQQKAEQEALKLEEQAEKIEDMTRRAGRAALEQAEQEVEGTLAAINTFSLGYGETGQAAPSPVLPLKEKMELAGKVGQAEKLKQVAELCGRMTRIALACQKSKVKHPPDEIIGISIGDDIAKMLPSETALLADPLLEDFFFKKYADKRLMQLDMIGSEKQGKGPIIVSLDSSGSMTATLGTKYSKEAWAKAVVLALLAIARKQKRHLSVIHFSGGSQMKVFTFLKGEGAPKELIATTEWFYGGGTAYHPWMQEALKIAESSKFDRADVICVSDGEVYIDPELERDWNTRRKARGMRSYGVLLGAGQFAKTLAQVCDAIVTIDNLTQDNAALALMFGI